MKFIILSSKNRTGQQPYIVTIKHQTTHDIHRKVSSIFTYPTH